MSSRELPQTFSINEILTGLAHSWSPQIIASTNGNELKIAKLTGAGKWHYHSAADELFLVWAGHIRIEFRGGSVSLGPGELTIVRKGVEHRPVADEPSYVLLFDPSGVRDCEARDDHVFTESVDRAC